MCQFEKLFHEVLREVVSHLNTGKQISTPSQPNLSMFTTAALYILPTREEVVATLKACTEDVGKLAKTWLDVDIGVDVAMICWPVEVCTICMNPATKWYDEQWGDQFQYHTEEVLFRIANNNAF